jgi:hypothetical protein
LARSEALAAAHRAMNALAPSEDMAGRIGAELACLQARPGSISAAGRMGESLVLGGAPVSKPA